MLGINALTGQPLAAPYVRIVVASVDFDNWGRQGHIHAKIQP